MKSDRCPALNSVSVVAMISCYGPMMDNRCRRHFVETFQRSFSRKNDLFFFFLKRNFVDDEMRNKMADF